MDCNRSSKLRYMPVTFTTGIYPYVTLLQDAHGNIHMWEGQVIPNQGALPKADGREADTIIFNQIDLNALKDHLPYEEYNMLNASWAIHTRNIPDDYLVHEF